jgi:hypothetical protein
MPQNIDFTKILEQVKSDLIALAQSTLKNYVSDAKKDALDVLEKTKEKLERWTLLLAKGSLSIADFEWLVNSQKDLVEMHGLKQAGLAAIRVDQFKNSVFNLIVDTVLHLVKI